MGSLPMKKIFDKSQVITDNIKSKVSNFSPLVAITVAQIIVELVKIYKECNNDDSFETRLVNGQRLIKLRLRMHINREIKRHNLSPEYKQIIFDEFLTQSQTITESELKELLNEVE